MGFGPIRSEAKIITRIFEPAAAPVNTTKAFKVLDLLLSAVKIGGDALLLSEAGVIFFPFRGFDRIPHSRSADFPWGPGGAVRECLTCCRQEARPTSGENVDLFCGLEGGD
jgi:hypothetical protein